MTEQEMFVKWNVAGEITIIDDLKNAPKRQAEWEDKFKGLPQTVAVSPSLYKVFAEEINEHSIR